MTTEYKNISSCTVRLLAIASNATYLLKKDNNIDHDLAETLAGIAEHRYDISKAAAPANSMGTGKSPLAALCLSPKDSKSPIIISFRGTKTRSDIFSDLRLGALGVVEQEFRDSAFKFYQEVRKDHPDREIILTGHSLGGHLAQYVAIKAYNTDPDLKANPLLQVRTFNTAPIQTTHSSVLESNPQIATQLVNYRLSNDIVSDLPLKEYYGNTYVFPSSHGVLSSHSLDTIQKSLPDDILNQQVGANSESEKKHNLLIEHTNGVLHSYQCRVNDQYFSRSRAGVKNLAEMQKIIPEALKLIKNHDYDNAIEKLDELKTKLNGKTSTQIVNELMKKTLEIKITRQIEHSRKPDVNPIKKQADMKAQLRELKNEKTNEAAPELKNNPHL